LLTYSYVMFYSALRRQSSSTSTSAAASIKFTEFTVYRAW